MIPPEPTLPVCRAARGSKTYVTARLTSIIVVRVRPFA
jgi:hypothetical protein